MFSLACNLEQFELHTLMEMYFSGGGMLSNVTSSGRIRPQRSSGMYCSQYVNAIFAQRHIYINSVFGSDSKAQKFLFWCIILRL